MLCNQIKTFSDYVRVMMKEATVLHEVYKQYTPCSAELTMVL